MELSDLFSRGTRLAEVPPDVRGMRLADWQRAVIAKQAEAWRKTLDPAAAPILKKPIATKRDFYGMKGI